MANAAGGKEGARVGWVSAVVDRLERDAGGRWLAVVLVGEKEQEFVLPRARLPKGAREGSWLQVRLDGGAIGPIRLDPAATAAARERVAAKLAKLRQASE
ncbi:MAG: DUF3006 domain-containing protein [Firmicutes bacterium]|nr:DUF3006 domain-containing protein [Bacillota bacterium]